MRFKTVIQLVSDARDKREAQDLVEEYLAGNIASGVDMKCVTKPVYGAAKVAGVAVLSLAIVAGIFLGSHIKSVQNVPQMASGLSAVQPPLKTSNIVKKRSEFKQEWQDRETKEALDDITR